MIELANAKVGDKIAFVGERMPYTVQARSDRFIVCTKPFNLKHTVIYSIIDLEEQVRGTENLVFGAGFETRKDCEEAVSRLEGKDEELGWATEVSHRNRVRLDVLSIKEAA
jgi:hypothetical protein